jgi:hypothetical protein
LSNFYDPGGQGERNEAAKAIVLALDGRGQKRPGAEKVLKWN